MKNAFVGVLLGLIVGAAVAAFAQAPALPPPAPVVQALDDTEQILVQLVSTQAKLAGAECNALDSMKQFTATRVEVVKRVEAKHPGYTLDLQTAKLVEKKK